MKLSENFDDCHLYAIDALLPTNLVISCDKVLYQVETSWVQIRRIKMTKPRKQHIRCLPIYIDQNFRTFKLSKFSAMLALSGPIELSTTGRCLDEAHWTCEKCRFHSKWSAIATYNLYMGIVFPGLWLANIVLSLLYCCLNGEICSNLLHVVFKLFWLRSGGYSGCATAICITMAIGMYYMYTY